jgi:hypothetical protein
MTAKRELPKVHLVIQNRTTQYMGPASAYGAVLAHITDAIIELLGTYPDYFTFNDIKTGILDIRDFQTTGVVAFA